MVVYDLLCKKNHRFEGWFPSFEEFQKQAGRGQISCPTCGSTKVEKMPHACAVLTRKEDHKEKRAPREQETATCSLTEPDVKELLIRLRQHVKENFEDVGSQFPEEARAIFHGRAEKRAIHGTSTPQEREELDEEGIPYAILPKPELDS